MLVSAAAHAVKRKLAVQGLPTILLVDHEGTILTRVVGWSTRDAGRLVTDAKRAVKKAREADRAGRR